MDAFFFGPPPMQLLGVYHPPDPTRDQYQGVVLCYPFGQEYMRAHRAFRQLAATLARKGFHVLRFDYRGTGDSSSELDQVTAGHWREDVECAVQELKDLAGLHQVALVGLRLGALLAGLVAARRRDVSCLVLWDPITAGEYYVEQVRADIRQRAARKKESKFLDARGNLHFNGFCMSRAFQRSLADMNLFEAKPCCRRVLLLGSHANPRFDDLAGSWRHERGFEHRHIPAEHDWNYVDHVGGILMPRPVLAEIGTWL